MAIDIMTKALSKNYTDKVSEGLGAIKGANCTIKSTTKTDGNSLVVFEWTGTSGTKETASITVKDGVSIVSISIDENNYLVCTMSDGTEKKAKIELLDNVYTKEETDNLLKDKAESTHNHDDLYASKDKEHEHLNKETLDKFGVNDNGKLTFDGDVVTPEASDLSDYLKKTDAQNTYVVKETGKGLSENDLTAALKEAYDKAVEASHTHSNKSVLDSITNEKIAVWDKAEENVQPNWDEIDDTADGFIKNKPTIPDITGLATETYVDNKVADYTKTVDLADVAKSGSYNDLNDKPTIPSLDGYAKTTEIPSKVSELENDSNYLSSIPEEYVTETELSAKGYLTEHQDISGKVDKVEGKSLISDAEITRLASVDNYDDTALSNRVKSIEDEVPNLATKTYVGEQITNAEHLKREIVTVLPSDIEASDNIIYMLKVESATGNDKYKEYMKIDGTVQMVGDTSVDLTDYAKTVEIPTTVAELTDSADYAKKTDLHSHENKTVLDGITEEKVTAWDKSQENIIESVKVNNQEITPDENKAVNIDLSDYAKTADIPTSLPANGGNASTVNGHTVNSDVPENAKFTDTTYSDATQIEHGLMSVDDKKKLDGLKKYTPDGTTITADEDGTLHGQSVDIMTVDKAGIGKPDGDTIEVSTDATISVSSKALTFSDHDTAKSGTSFTDAEDGNMLVTNATKNLLNPTLETTTINGVTCTNNGDGTYTLNGTATSENALFKVNINRCIEYGKTYRVVGCPQSGGSGKYGLEATDQTIYGVNDYGDGAIFNPYETGYEYKILIVVYKNYTVNNLIFKPMLTTDLSATYDDFVPYSGYDIKTCGKNLMSVNDATNGATLDAQDRFNIRIRGLDKGNIVSDRIYLLKNGVTKGHQSFTFKVTIDEPYGIAIKHNGSTNDIDIEYINYMVRKGTYTISFDAASNNPSVEGGLLLHNIQLEHGDTETDFEPYQDGGTVHIDSTTEFPLLGLKSFDGETNIISPANVKCVYPTNESGKGVLDSLYNKDKMLTEQNKSLDTLEFGEVAAGKNLFKGDFIKKVLDTDINYTDIDLSKEQNPIKNIEGITFVVFGAYLKKGTYTFSYTNNAYFSLNRIAIAGTNCISIIESIRKSYTWTQNTDGWTYFGIEGDDSETGVTDTPFSITPNIQIEEGTQATEYEPYIPSVKMLTDEVSVQNKNLSVIGKCKNLLNPTLETTTQNGVTCTNNGDGTYTINGTATQNTDFTFFDNLGKYQHLKNRTVKLVGCPKDGSDTTYRLMLQLQKAPWPSAIDIGKGSSVTVDNNDNWACWIRIYKDATVSNLTFKPMLVYDDKTPNATYDDFVPYTGDGETLVHDVAKLNENLGTLGKCKNLLKPVFVSGWGCNCVIGDDGKITLTSTNTQDYQVVIGYIHKCSLKANKTYYFRAFDIINIDQIAIGKIGSDDLLKSFYNQLIYTPTEDMDIQLLIYFSDKTVGTISSCYISVSEVYTDEYVPYTGDGETLTHDVAEIKNDLGGLSFSASGTTLSITDGTNTWTLEANS